jgi:hypothetical protein
VIVSTQQRAYKSYNLKNVSGFVADVNLLVSNWDESRSVQENLDAAVGKNLFGKATRKRVDDILRVFRERYLPEDGSARAFRILVGSSLPSEITDRVIYYYTALAEPLLYDFVTEYLRERYLRGEQRVTVSNATEFIEQSLREGRMAGKWESEQTRGRVARGLMATLRDLGVLGGAKQSHEKTLLPAHLHILAFAYVAFHIHCSELSSARLVHHPHWRLFFLGTREVERYFAEADAYKLLSYQAAGSIIRIEFPTDDFEEYVHVLIEKPY